MSSAPRGRATRPPSRLSARPATPWHSARPRAPQPGLDTRSGSCPTTAPADARVELLLSRARALVATGQFADGHAALLESIALVPADSVALRVRLTTACAGVEHLLGRHEQAHARLASAMDGLRDPASREAAALMIELAMDGFFRMDYELMREWAERALSTARPLGDRPLTAAAVAVLRLRERDERSHAGGRSTSLGGGRPRRGSGR